MAYIPLDLMNGDGIEAAIAAADGTFDGLAFIAGILRVMKILPPA